MEFDTELIYRVSSITVSIMNAAQSAVTARQEDVFGYCHTLHEEAGEKIPWLTGYGDRWTFQNMYGICAY